MTSAAAAENDDDITDVSTSSQSSCEVCGWVAALLSMVAFGSFGVPVKSRPAQNLNVDPLVMQSYKSFVCFVTSWFVLLLNRSQSSTSSSSSSYYPYGDSDDIVKDDDEWISSSSSSQATTTSSSSSSTTSFQFTPWGVVSGLFWVPGGVATIYAIQNAGLCVSLGISSSCIVLVSFTWGVFVFGEQVHSRVQSTLAVLCMVCGIVGMTYFSSPTPTPTSTPTSSETNNNEVEIVGHYSSVKTTITNQPIHNRNMPSSLVYQKVPTTNPATTGRNNNATTVVAATAAAAPIATRNAINNTILRGASDVSDVVLETLYQDEPDVHDRGGVNDNENDKNDSNDNDKNVSIVHGERLGAVDEPSTSCTTKTSLDGIEYPVVSNQEEEEEGRDVQDGMIRRPLRNRPRNRPRNRNRNRSRGILAAIFNGMYGGSIMVPMRYAPPGASGKLYVISFSIGALIVTVGLWILRFMYNLFVQQQKQQQRQRYGYGPSPSPSSSSFVEAYEMLPSFHFRQMWYYGGLCGLLWSIGNFFSILSVSYLGEGVGYSVIQCAMIVSGLWGIFYFHELQDPRRICLWFGSATVAITGILILSYEHHAVSE